MTLRAKAQAVDTEYKNWDGRSSGGLSRSIGAMSKWLRENPEGELPAEGAYLIAYEDRDKQCETFSNAGARDAALKRFEEISDSWNAHLYVKIRSNSQDCTVANYSPTCSEPVPRVTCPECCVTLYGEAAEIGYCTDHAPEPVPQPEAKGTHTDNLDLEVADALAAAELASRPTTLIPEAVRCFVYGKFELFVMQGDSGVCFELDNQRIAPSNWSLAGLEKSTFHTAITPTAARQLLAEADWPEGLVKFDDKVTPCATNEVPARQAKEVPAQGTLLTCPFCESTDCFVAVLCEEFYVECKTCESGGALKQTKREAIEAWNKRPGELGSEPGVFSLPKQWNTIEACVSIPAGRYNDLLAAEQERDRLRAEVEAKAETMRKAYIEQARLTSENEKLKKECDGWHGVVTDCEKVLRMEGTAESPLMSNLANVCRDKMSRIYDLETEVTLLTEKLVYLKSCGLTVGMLKDQHGERLAYDIASGSELSEDLTLSKLLDAEIERDRLRAEVESARELLDDYLDSQSPASIRNAVEALGTAWMAMTGEVVRKGQQIAALTAENERLKASGFVNVKSITLDGRFVSLEFESGNAMSDFLEQCVPPGQAFQNARTGPVRSSWDTDDLQSVTVFARGNGVASLKETAVQNPKDTCSYFPPNSLSMNNTPNR